MNLTEQQIRHNGIRLDAEEGVLFIEGVYAIQSDWLLKLKLKATALKINQTFKLQLTNTHRKDHGLSC